MFAKSRKSLGLGVATGAVALALSGLPISLDIDSATVEGNAALAAPGGNGKGKGNANGRGQGLEASSGQQAKAAHAKGHYSKDDPMHPSNLGRLNGFLNASPQALKNTSSNSAIGILSQTYRDALLDYMAASEESEETEETAETLETDELAAILAQAANKPLTGEQVLAIHEKLIAENPELAEAVTPEETATETPESDEETETVDLMDPDFADQLAEEANVIQSTETNQGLGTGDDGEGDDTEGGVGEALADAGDAVADAAEDTAEAVGEFFDETF